MIAGIFHKGSGMGNQLFRYITARTLALDKGCDFGMVAPELFKGSSFMNLDMGKKLDIEYSIMPGTGKVIPLWGEPIWEEKGFYYNPEINYLEDNTIIDGNFEDSRYWEHRMPEIDEWLKVEPRIIDENICVIGFRGGEYVGIPELFLPTDYWVEAVNEMLKINPKMRFEVHTDDVETARNSLVVFLKYHWPVEFIHDISINWRSMRYAKYAIIANSSFYVLPRLLKHHENKEVITISPKYWNRYNTKEWEYPQNYYKQFIHI